MKNNDTNEPQGQMTQRIGEYAARLASMISGSITDGNVFFFTNRTICCIYPSIRG